MASGCYPNHLEELVASGEVDEKWIDRAVENVLRVKFELGLFENPYGVLEDDAQPFGKPEYRALARRAAQESIVLLKKNGVLPLKKDAKIAVFGKLADARGEMAGTWALNSHEEEFVSLFDGLKNAGADAHLLSNPILAETEEVLILALGEGELESGEAASKTSLELSHEQRSLLRKAATSGKKLVVVLFNGRPMVLGELVSCADAIVEAWHPGVEGGNAIADVLFGDYNPSGKLTATFPRATGACPCYYDQTSTGRPATKVQYTSRYIDQPIEPMFPFGWGLSYTSFAYSDLTVQKQEDAFAVCVNVKNTGTRAGTEIVQCYFHDPVAQRTRPVKRLVAYQRLPLEPGQMQTVRFRILFDQLAYYNVAMERVVEEGAYDFMVGGNSKELLQTRVVL